MNSVKKHSALSEDKIKGVNDPLENNAEAI